MYHQPTQFQRIWCTVFGSAFLFIGVAVLIALIPGRACDGTLVAYTAGAVGILAGAVLIWEGTGR